MKRVLLIAKTKSIPPVVLGEYLRNLLSAPDNLVLYVDPVRGFAKYGIDKSAPNLCRVEGDDIRALPAILHNLDKYLTENQSRAPSRVHLVLDHFELLDFRGALRSQLAKMEYLNVLAIEAVGDSSAPVVVLQGDPYIFDVKILDDLSKPYLGTEVSI